MEARRSNWVPFEVTVRLRTMLDQLPGGPQSVGGSNATTAGSSVVEGQTGQLECVSQREEEDAQ